MLQEIQLIEELTKLRRTIHSEPELSGKEFKTAKKIKDFLVQKGVETIIEEVGGTGLLAIIEFSSDGPTIMLRAELDALPIQEVNEFEHKSTSDGISHKCGHDGHMTILAGMAALLTKKNMKKGRVLLLFQPAEENGMGARAVLDDNKFSSYSPDMVFAFHNIPGIPLNKVVCRKGSLTPSVKSMIIHLDGKTSHASEPENGINPALAIAEIIAGADKLNVAQDRDDFKLITPIQIEMGEEAYGISAGHAIIRLTLRSWKNEVMEQLCQEMKSVCIDIAKKHGIQARFDWTQYFAACENDPSAVDIIASAASASNLKYENKKQAFKWGEDFGLFTDDFRGAMFGIGAGETCPALHNPDYDFPDELIGTGMMMFDGIINHVLTHS